MSEVERRGAPPRVHRKFSINIEIGAFAFRPVIQNGRSVRDTVKPELRSASYEPLKPAYNLISTVAGFMTWTAASEKWHRHSRCLRQRR